MISEVENSISSSISASSSGGGSIKTNQIIIGM